MEVSRVDAKLPGSPATHKPKAGCQDPFLTFLLSLLCLHVTSVINLVRDIKKIRSSV